MDSQLSIFFKTPQDVQRDLADRFKARRLAMNLTQEGLAARSGVSWGSLKRFEHTGFIALDSLLRIAMVLDCLRDFETVGVADRRTLSEKTLDEILAEPKTRKKGRLK
jgi:transcriptional regulator with XRE-family HTH domain